MKTIQVKSHIGKDGILSLRIPTNEKEADVEVLVVIEKKNAAPHEWQEGFFDNTFGCFNESPITRLPQGDVDTRDSLR